MSDAAGNEALDYVLVRIVEEFELETMVDLAAVGNFSTTPSLAESEARARLVLDPGEEANQAVRAWVAAALSTTLSNAKQVGLGSIKMQAKVEEYACEVTGVLTIRWLRKGSHVPSANCSLLLGRVWSLSWVGLVFRWHTIAQWVF